ncbi:MAG: hypothetical protein JSV57_04430 [Candidatus Bathyarchaeota archaeon]|nr:MAG: hypothetical protein JSV57_04430 [Candidatus Bathyarchaeota archaeon]
MSAIDDVIELLEDGKWRTFEDIANNLQMEQQKVQQIVRFLEDLTLLKLDKKRKKASIDLDLKELMALEH